MSNKTRIDKLIQHYRDPINYPITPELEEYQERLDYCRDLLKRHDVGTTWRMLKKKFEYSRASAYNDISDTKKFFSRDFDTSDRPFETVMAIERLQKLYDMAFNAAKTAKDFYHCSRILEQINTLKGLFTPEQEFDPRLLRPSVIQLVIPTGGRPRVIDVQKQEDFSLETIDLIEGIHFSVDEMKKEIEKNSDGSADN